MESTHELIIYYKYTPIADPDRFMDWQRCLCESLGLRGRILIAKEGINGTLEGTCEAIAQYEARMQAQDGSAETFGNFSDVWFKSSPGTGKSFKKLKIKVRSEIVTTGLPKERDVDPTKETGTYLEAEELKQWIDRGEAFEIVDMRNEYEFAVGRFAGSHGSGMENFRDLEKVMPALEPLRNRKVVTVCTYGVRCEKASAYLKQQGFNDVYQLHGGIGTYMKKYPGQDFKGSLYVFDERMVERFTDAYEVIGACVACNARTERFGNCGWDECHKQLIICEGCSTAPRWCSQGCQDKKGMARS